ncbi:MAG: hypothetical protein JNL61_15580 [Rhizobiaceae bacterium]|nr:hypothetical protein [Rhizobiaceae bacterium]
MSMKLKGWEKKTAESKADATTRAARQLFHEETAAREAKTARLKAARLALEAQSAGEVLRKPKLGKGSRG